MIATGITFQSTLPGGQDNTSQVEFRISNVYVSELVQIKIQDSNSSSPLILLVAFRDDAAFLGRLDLHHRLCLAPLLVYLSFLKDTASQLALTVRFLCSLAES